jgi:hypothetical protein
LSLPSLFSLVVTSLKNLISFDNFQARVPSFQIQFFESTAKIIENFIIKLIGKKIFVWYKKLKFLPFSKGVPRSGEGFVF